MSITMVWLGGPKDGAEIVLPNRWNGEPIKVISGPKATPEERYVTPRLDRYGHWVLPFYEGKATEETR